MIKSFKLQFVVSIHTKNFCISTQVKCMYLLNIVSHVSHIIYITYITYKMHLIWIEPSLYINTIICLVLHFCQCIYFFFFLFFLIPDYPSRSLLVVALNTYCIVFNAIRYFISHMYTIHHTPKLIRLHTKLYCMWSNCMLSICMNSCQEKTRAKQKKKN